MIEQSNFVISNLMRQRKTFGYRRVRDVEVIHKENVVGTFKFQLNIYIHHVPSVRDIDVRDTTVQLCMCALCSYVSYTMMSILCYSLYIK